MPTILDTRHKMDKLPERCKLSKLVQKETENFNTPITSLKNWVSNFKKLQTKKSQDPDDLLHW